MHRGSRVLPLLLPTSPPSTTLDSHPDMPSPGQFLGSQWPCFLPEYHPSTTGPSSHSLRVILALTKLKSLSAFLKKFLVLLVLSRWSSLFSQVPPHTTRKILDIPQLRRQQKNHSCIKEILKTVVLLKGQRRGQRDLNERRVFILHSKQ